MTDFFSKIFDRLGNFRDIDYDDYDQEYYEESAEEEEVPEAPKHGPFRRQPTGKVVDLRSGGQQQVVIMQPADIDSAQEACDHIRSGKTVICNIEKVDPKVAQRVIDFITGAAYALDGKVMPVSSVIFVVAPRQTALLEGNIIDESMEYVRKTGTN